MPKIRILPVVAAGVIGIAVLTGLGLAGTFDSDDSTSSRVQDPLVTPASTLTPRPTSASSDTMATIPDPTDNPAPSPTEDVEEPLVQSDGPERELGTTESTEVSMMVEPDPNFEEALKSARFTTFPWLTDFSLHSVPFSEITGGGVPRDGIPPLDNPTFTTISDADGWLGSKEPVIAFEINGDARAYPLQILTWHEIVNDVVGGVPVAVTFCPLCNSAIVFDRRLGQIVYDFGTSGNLRNSDLIMWDRQTQSWWQQFTGEAIVGELTGTRLTFRVSTIISWEDFKTANTDGQVLSRDTGYSRDYGRNPYAGYDRADNPPFLFDGDLDGRLLPKERVAAVTIGEEDIAFPFSVLEKERVVNYTVNGQDLAVFFKLGTASALDGRSISDSRDVGSTGVFDPNLDGRKLTFRAAADQFMDNETGSKWNILGEAIDGPLAGATLNPIVHANHFWFAWAAFKPNTEVDPKIRTGG